MPIGVPKVPYRLPGDIQTQWVDIYNRLSRERVLFLTQDIEDEITNQLIGLLLYLSSEDAKRDVFLYVNSPGGSPVQSHMIYKLIREQAKENKKKVIVFAEDVAASGGYLIACAGDEIYANQSSIIGSIGVIFSSFGFKDLIKKIGVDRRVYTAGKNKSTLDPFLEEKPEDIERLKKIQLEIHQDFIEVVEESRKNKLNKNSGVELFSGEFWSGKKAKELGLIDEIGNLNQVLREKFGKDVVIKKFEKPKSWISKKLSSSEERVEKIVGVLEERSIWQRYGF